MGDKTPQQKLADFVTDPNTIARAVEGSMERRMRVMDDDKLRRKLYELADSFLVEAKDQHGNDRSVDRLNQDRHLFVANALVFIKTNSSNLLKEVAASEALADEEAPLSQWDTPTKANRDRNARNEAKAALRTELLERAERELK